MSKLTRVVAAGLLAAATFSIRPAEARSHPIYGYGSYAITFYFPTGNLTATGNPTYYGEIAVDPGTIPLCSWVHIEGLGTFRALDTGGAVWGRHLDVLVYSWSQGYRVVGSGYRKAYWWRGQQCYRS